MNFEAKFLEFTKHAKMRGLMLDPEF